MKFKNLKLILILILMAHNVSGQVFITRNGTIRFYSEAPLENIEAVNRQVSTALDTQTGAFVFNVIMRSFTFEKALMQQHFNDNFVASHTYPNATFEGEIMEIDAIDFRHQGVYDVTVQGALTIKDVTHDISQQGVLTVGEETIHAHSVFFIRPQDYNVSIPARFVMNISEEIEITVDVTLERQ